MSKLIAIIIGNRRSSGWENFISKLKSRINIFPATPSRRGRRVALEYPQRTGRSGSRREPAQACQPQPKIGARRRRPVGRRSTDRGAVGGRSRARATVRCPRGGSDGRPTVGTTVARHPIVGRQLRRAAARPGDDRGHGEKAHLGADRRVQDVHVPVADQGPRLQEQGHEERGVRVAVAADQKVCARAFRHGNRIGEYRSSVGGVKLSLSENLQNVPGRKSTKTGSL